MKEKNVFMKKLHFYENAFESKGEKLCENKNVTICPRNLYHINRISQGFNILVLNFLRCFKKPFYKCRGIFKL